jgi:hypothetical protein
MGRLTNWQSTWRKCAKWMIGPRGLAGHLNFRFSFNPAFKAAIKTAKLAT